MVSVDPCREVTAYSLSREVTAYSLSVAAGVLMSVVRSIDAAFRNLSRIYYEYIASSDSLMCTVAKEGDECLE